MKTKYKVKVMPWDDIQVKYDLFVVKEEGSTYPSSYTLKHKRNDPLLFSEFRGKTVMSVEDTGNKMIIQKHDGEEFCLDYAQFQELFIIMMAENDLYTKAVIKIKEAS